MVGNYEIIDFILLEKGVDWMYSYTLIFSGSSIRPFHTSGPAEPDSGNLPYGLSFSNE